MGHKGMCIGGICTSGVGVSILTNILPTTLSLSSNPTLQAIGAIITVVGVAVFVIGYKK